MKCCRLKILKCRGFGRKAGDSASGCERCKQLISDAERRGKEYAEKARADAEAKVNELLSEAQAEASGRRALNRAEAEERCKALEAAALSRLDEAAAKIVERIVNA